MKFIYWVCIAVLHLQESSKCQVLRSYIIMGKTTWGSWRSALYCPKGTRVRGFRLKYDSAKSGDRTALNGIQLQCSNRRMTAMTNGLYGSWRPVMSCTGQGYVTGFNFRSERNKGNFYDDVAGVNVQMQCSDTSWLHGGGGYLGTWNGSRYCATNTYFCGVQARIDTSTYVFTDKTSLNQLKFLCCQPENAVNGGWGSWVSSPCSKTCGGGGQRKYRYCNRPAPSNGGLKCRAKDGISKDYEQTYVDCNIQNCPVHGHWSNWKKNSCTKSCGGGSEKKYRFCDNPSPRSGGVKCAKENGIRDTYEEIISDCNTQNCLEIKPAMIGDDGNVSFIIILPILEGNIRNYDVIVVELGVLKIFPRASPKLYTLSDIENNVDGLYVAGRVADKNMFGNEFVIGIGDQVENRRSRRSLPAVANKLLKNDTYYGVFVRGYITDTNHVSSDWYPAVKFESKEDDGLSVGVKLIIIIAVIAALVLITIVILIVICCRRKKTRPKKATTIVVGGAPGTTNMAFNPEIMTRPAPNAPTATLDRPLHPNKTQNEIYEKIGPAGYDGVHFEKNQQNAAVIPPRRKADAVDVKPYVNPIAGAYEQAIDDSKQRYTKYPPLELPQQRPNPSAVPPVNPYELLKMSHQDDYVHLGITPPRTPQPIDRGIAGLETSYDNNLQPTNYDSNLPPVAYNSSQTQPNYDVNLPLPTYDTNLPPVNYDTNLRPNAEGHYLSVEKDYTDLTRSDDFTTSTYEALR